MADTVRLHILLSRKNADDVAKIREMVGLLHDTEVIRLAIVEMASRYLGTGVRVDPIAAFKPGRPRKGAATKEDKELAEAYQVADDLKGEIVDGQNGNKVLKYKIYEVVNPKRVEEFEQEIPLLMATKDLVGAQYKPSKDEVLKVQKIMNAKKK